MFADLVCDLLAWPSASPIVRLLLAAMTAFLAGVILGRPYIAWLKQKGIQDGDSVKASEKLQDLHEKSGKARTPTMGGPVILAGCAVAALVWAPLANPVVWIALGVMLALALLGSVDDRAKLMRKPGRDGMRARTKLLLQMLIGVAAAIGLWFAHDDLATRSIVMIPFIDATLDLGLGMIPFIAFVIVGSSNAANFTDGLDGLAGGVSLVVALVMTGFALLAGGIIVVMGAQALPSGALPLADAMAVATIACGLIGGLLAFLWFNAPPAEVFMGDTGSLPLGGVLGFLACAVKFEIAFAVVAGVLVAEVGSVILQVASFKLTGKRIFKCSPIHHHFQFLGWAETKIVVRFWIVTLLLAFAGVLVIAARM